MTQILTTETGKTSEGGIESFTLFQYFVMIYSLLTKINIEMVFRPFISSPEPIRLIRELVV